MQHDLSAPPVIGHLSAGPRNSICDVAGVRVGHFTRSDGPIQTGITVVRLHDGDPYRQKVPAAAAVINGFGKSIGLVQVDELGLLETPIALTNTFSVGTLANAQIRAACAANPEIGRAWPSVNPLVMECNDGYLNDMQAMCLSEADYHAAYTAADTDVIQGSVGAGRGMSCFDLKGGIGSASRLVVAPHDATSSAADTAACVYTVGALVLANFGKLATLTLNGRPIGRELAQTRAKARANTDAAQPEKGSIIMIIGTDAPLEAIGLRRLARRAAAGLARTGSVYGHGSGDIALAFTTAQTVSHDPTIAPTPPVGIHPAAIDPFFAAAAEAVEQAIIHALWFATSVTGRDGHARQTLREALHALAAHSESD